jgi:hypothetical protein
VDDLSYSIAESYIELNNGDPEERISHYVLFFKELGIYVKISGWYNSWDTTQFDTVVQVFPHNVVKKVWRETPQSTGNVNEMILSFELD